MTVYVENLLSCEFLKEFRNKLVEFQIDEDFLAVMFPCLKSSKFSPEGKICFRELIVEIFEKDIELLDFHIELYNFQDPKQFLENIPSRKQEEIIFPFDLQIDENYVFKYKTKTIEL